MELINLNKLVEKHEQSTYELNEMKAQKIMAMFQEGGAAQNSYKEQDE